MKKNINGVKIFKSKIFADNRGFFKEIYKKKFLKNKQLVFHCASSSKKNVLRGLHHQTKNPQGKFLTVVKGRIFDVLVDLRKNSKTFGKTFSMYLSEKNPTSLIIPRGCAHGFLGLKKENIVYYLCDNYRSKKNEIGIKWNDKDLNIKWPIKNPKLSQKDKNNINFEFYKKNFLNKK
jgi:dTDP-4-dehydrorhamnose 3,5-epimerase